MPPGIGISLSPFIHNGTNVKLYIPASLISSTKTDTAIDLLWSGTVNEIAIEQSTDGNTFAPLATVPAGTQKYTVTGLNSYTKYYHRVREFKGNSYSDYSRITSKVTAYPNELYDNNTIWYKADELNTLAKDTLSQTNQVYDFLGVGAKLNQNTINRSPIWIDRVGLKFEKALTKFLKTAAMTINQPATIHLLFRQDSWTVGLYVLAGNTNDVILTQNGVTPLLYAAAGAYIHSPDTIAIGTFGICTICFNGANSYMQINGGTKYTGDAGIKTMGGLSLGGNANEGSWSDITVKDLILKRTLGTDDIDAKIFSMLNNKKAYDAFDYSENAAFTSLWGKKMLAIGDSTSVTGSGQSKVGAAFNMTVTTHALGGLGIINVIDGGGTLAALSSAELTGIDYVRLFVGLNDRVSLVGDITDTYPVKSTICAMYNYALDAIISRAATAGNTTLKIIPVLPHNVGKYSYIDATGTDEYPVGSGQTLESVVNKLEQLTISRGLKPINLFNLAGFNSNNWSFLTVNTPAGTGATYPNNDNVHPSELGYRIMADEEIRQMKNDYL